MQIVAERLIVPRPLQRPSDVERRPIDFGIEPPPPAPQKPEATIIKSAVSRDLDPIAASVDESTNTVPVANIAAVPESPVVPNNQKSENQESVEEEWGEGIL